LMSTEDDSGEEYTRKWRTIKPDTDVDSDTDADSVSPDSSLSQTTIFDQGAHKT
jgi:hypothetical protein